MTQLICVRSGNDQCFTEGNVYEADDDLGFIVGNDGDAKDPWVLSGMNVIAFNSKLASFELATPHHITN